MEALSCPSENSGLLPWVYQMVRMVNALHPGHVDEILCLTATLLHYLQYTASHVSLPAIFSLMMSTAP